jgi:hypothetical protein
MNCANHLQNPAVAYCRTCGKPLCSNCTRQVMGVIYCENCLAERMAGSAPPASPYQPPAGYAAPLPTAGGPNSTIAGILAGFFPFGVGAVYCGQYAKGLAHLIVCTLLIVAQANATSGGMHIVLAFMMAGFYFYQIIDAIRSAKAIQMGQPAPDPFGLATMFSPGSDRSDFSRGIPTGAVVLIVLGCLFLINNLDIPFLRFDTLWPLILVALGAWLFIKRKSGADLRNRSIAGPALLVTLGLIFLMDNLHGPDWQRTWPFILLVLGILKLMERGYLGGPPAPPAPPPASVSSASSQPPAEVNSEVKNG